MMIRSDKLLRGARGQSCTNCGAKDGTVVAAHIQGLRAAQFGKGKGIKPHDLCIADLCRRCHDMFDRYTISPYEDRFVKKIDHSERFMACILKTLVRRCEQEILKF